MISPKFCKSRFLIYFQNDCAICCVHPYCDYTVDYGRNYKIWGGTRLGQPDNSSFLIRWIRANWR